MIFDKLLRKKEENGRIRDRDLVCRCMGVRAGQVRACIRQGNTTLEALQEKLGVMSACGFCEYKIRRVLEEELAETGNA